jgi:hypothetical protein
MGQKTPHHRFAGFIKHRGVPKLPHTLGASITSKMTGVRSSVFHETLCVYAELLLYDPLCLHLRHTTQSPKLAALNAQKNRAI